MQLGWIDFSKTERNKVLTVLDMLSQPGTLDELGIAPVRDGFSDLFFPGTSTIQTRAKYFLIVPYALKDLELSSETNPHRLIKDMDALEKECAVRLLEKSGDTEGVIGSRSLNQGGWVKRPPSSIYWSGLRSYGIFTSNLSLSEYIWRICEQKTQKKALLKLGNRNDREEDKDQDDWDAGRTYNIHFWTIPTYEDKWKERLNLNLTTEEGAFLRRQILMMHPDSMLAYIIKNKRRDILNCNNFEEMADFTGQFPEQMQNDYWLAYDFSEFLFVLRILYNVILSEGKNEAANRLWTEKHVNFSDIASVNIEGIIERLHLYGQTYLCRFLRKAKELMIKDDVEGLKKEIKRRELELKGARAKTAHPGEFEEKAWFGGGQLDYRFGNAGRIINDILESEDCHV